MRAGQLLGVLGAAAMLALAGQPGEARAAAGVDWTGPYAGAFAGYGWGRSTATPPFDPGPGFFYNFGGERYSFDVDGFQAGGLAGMNWQSGRFVFGVEGELGYLGLRGSALDPNGVVLGFDDTRTTFKSDFYGAGYARAGIAAGDVLLFGKAGVAVLNSRATTIDPCVAPPAGCGTQTLHMSGSRRLPGWSVGGGAEWNMGGNWSLRTDYAFLDFGRMTATGISNVGEPYTQRVTLRAHTARLGISHRW